jgi:hypothetical protein
VGIAISVVEVFIPTLESARSVSLDDFLETVEFLARKPSASLEADGINPKLCFAVVMLDVDVRRFVPIARVEEEPIGAVSEDRRHGIIIGHGGSTTNRDEHQPMVSPVEITESTRSRAEGDSRSEAMGPQATLERASVSSDEWH